MGARVAGQSVAADSKTYRAYKAIVRLVHRRGLGRGDRLPPQRELRATLGMSNDTLTAAMRSLVRAGVLERRRRTGTVVANAGAIGPVAWSVGVAVIPAPATGPVSFYSDLAFRLHSHVARTGWRPRIYHRSKASYPGRIADFTGLKDDVSDGALDGLVLLTTLHGDDWSAARRRGVVPCHVSSWEGAPCGVLIDERTVARQAVGLLASRGRRRLAALHTAKPGRRKARFWDGFREGLTEAGLSQGSAERLGCGESLEGGERAARGLLSRRPKDRPEGLVLFDNYIAMGLAEALREAGGYRPDIAVITHRQLPLVFPLPVIQFELDIDELARRTVSLMEERLPNPSLSERVDWLAPALVTRSPRRLPAVSAGTRDSGNREKARAAK